MMPSLFVSHGSPIIAIEDNEYTKFLAYLGRRFPRPKAIALFSAHWESDTEMVSEATEYETIYDFGGFPEALYQITYPAKGSPQVAKEIEQMFEKDSISYQIDDSRGLDHGEWVVLRFMYPNADVPVVSMSINPDFTPAQQYKIGKSLEALREQDVLIIGSGVTVHNLGLLERNDTRINDWAVEFDDWLSANITEWNLDALFQYDKLAPHVRLAVPLHGNEHFVPLFYAMGAADSARQVKLLHRSYRFGNLSQSIWQFA
ncbi:DODA-type extradiol aromatic ring-opening family dioxygenase [Alicyclobacillus dauci]|uniref:Dioxygenase n=1 Tax=Alicyclobacillus dauci TaxID=1475485 RepID=A0ABY6YYU6_9BACL|nr:class III extradiol ring-cleavage dioxygenase [Alicyclobacillus dauci]WAH35680.1 dioxygenase [Alicyclobacillus dauci]